MSEFNNVLLPDKFSTALQICRRAQRYALKITVKLEVNREELEKKLSNITSALLKEKGYISLVDVFIGLGYLSEKDVEEWRMKRIPYLEKCIGVNLSKASYIVKTVRSNCIKGKLRESYTSYKSWGKGKKSALRFSKSGQSNIEVAYATHFTKPKSLA